MTSKTKMKDYLDKMFHTKESTSSTDRLIGSSLSSELANGQTSSVAPLLFHSLPISQKQQQRVYRPTTISVHHQSVKYDGYEPLQVRNSLRSSRRESSTAMNLEKRQYGWNLKRAFDTDSRRKELDLGNATVQAQDSEQRGEARLAPQILAALSVSMGSFVVGYVSGYTSPAGDSLTLGEKTVPDAKEYISYIGGIMPLCALLGGVAGGPLIEFFGRKTTILLTAIPFIFSWLLIACAINVPMILAGRAIAGFCVGLTSLSLPVYLGETIQPEVRGVLGLLPTAFGNTGILVVYFAGMFLDWSNLSFLGAAIPIPFLILVCIIPETPTWYLSKGKTEQARNALQWLRGKSCDITEEFDEIEKAAAKNAENNTSLRNLFDASNVKPILITIFLMVFQQFSGINAVIFYTSTIFRLTGSNLDNSVCTIIVGIVNFFATFAATTVIDRMGRKMLLYISSLVMITTLTVLGTYMFLKDVPSYKEFIEEISWLPLLSFVFYIIGFSVGFGPVPWLMMGELLPASVRGPAASLATGINWTCCSLVTLTFTGLTECLGTAITFWMFATICAAGLVFVRLCVPETRGKTLEDIERKFKKPVRRMSSVANLKPTPLAV